MNIKYILVFFLIGLISCQKKKNSTPVVEAPYQFELPEWAKNATIYEANTRHMSEAGDFKSLQAQLPRLKDMGVDIIWLMPIHPISVLKRKATGDVLVKDIKNVEERKKYLGSPYAVADYKKVNPDFGTDADFKALIQDAHSRNMRIIIDGVPNHTGWDHAWIKDHPEWFTKGKDGEITDPINDDGEKWGWTDVADLNYNNADMRKEMIQELLYWVNEFDIDGYRMDVAHGIEQSFWDEVAPILVKAKKDIFLLAEAEVPSHRNEKTFHTSYGWTLHHILNEIARGEKTAVAIDDWFVEDGKKFSNGFHMHFTSNHDENAWAGPAPERMGDAHLTLAALAATFDGMPLLYSGMEEPITTKLPFFTKGNIGFKDYKYAPFYKKLFNLKHDNRAIWNGQYGGALVKLSNHEHIYAFSREKNGDQVFGIFNLSKDRHSFTIPQNIAGKDIITGQSVNWKKDTALGMEPWQYYVLSNK